MAKSAKRWPILCDFCKRWPSQQKGGQYCAIFAKGGQVSKMVANILRSLRKVAKSVERWPSQQKGDQYCAIFAKGGQVSRKVANIVRFLRTVAKSVERWPMLYDFRKRWPSQ